MARAMVLGCLVAVAWGATGTAAEAENAGTRRDAFKVRYGSRQKDVQFPLILKIGLMEAQTEVKLKPPTDAWMQLGSQRWPVGAGQDVNVKWLSGQPAQIRYHLALKTFPSGRLEAADTQISEYKAQGIAARLLPWGNRLTKDSVRPLHDHRRVFVVIDEFTDLEDAEAAVLAWNAKGERPFLVESLLGMPRAEVEVSWGGQSVTGVAPLVMTATGSKVHVYNVEFGVGDPWHGHQDRDYHGSILVAADRLGKLAAVNEVELERYLRGVVPSEILPSSPTPALRSQAVAARGEALAKYNLRHFPDPYDICSSTHCQVYGGITKETNRTTLAVVATSGIVMQHTGHIVDAVYAAVCGGHSEANDKVWTSPPDAALRARRDGVPADQSPVTDANIEAFLADTESAWCRKAKSDKFRWKKRFTQAQIRTLLAEKAQINVGTIKDLRSLGRGYSGRLLGLEVVGTQGSATIMKELPIRRAFGGLRSALFAIDREVAGGKLAAVRFRGAGWGHGVGLCQVGARAQAAAGRDYQEILKSYYSGIELNKVDD